MLQRPTGWGSDSLLKEFDYPAQDVPSVDADIEACVALVGQPRLQCWADLDTKLMEEVVPWVPWLINNSVFVTSDQVMAFSFDQSSSQPGTGADGTGSHGKLASPTRTANGGVPSRPSLTRCGGAQIKLDMTGKERERRFRAALSHRDYRLLLSSLAVSETGNWLYAAATIIYILDATGSAAWVGVAAVVRLSPYILFEPLGGAIADRYDRRKVMITADLARAVVMCVMALVATSTSHTAVAVVIALTFVNNTFTAPYYPAVTALTPSVVPERDLAAANALAGTIDNFALAFGPGLSAILLLLGPAPIAIALNGITFLVSAFLVARMHVSGKVGEVDTEPGLLSRMVAGVKAIHGSSQATLLIGLGFAFGLTFGQEVVLYGPIAEGSLGIGIDATGLLFAMPGIGGILVTALAARLAARSHTAGILTAAVFLGGVPLTTL